MKHISSRLFVFSLIIGFFIQGCYLSPEPNIPEYKIDNAQTQSVDIDKKWWESYDDSELNKFMDELFANNSDIKLAALRVLEFQSLLNLSRANRYPDINGAGEARNQKTSSETYPKGGGSIYDTYSIGAEASFDLDLFGKLRNANNAAFEELLQAEYNQEAIKLQIASSGVLTYFGLKSAKTSYLIAKDTFESRKESFIYRKNQKEAGVINESVLLNEESLMESAFEEMLARKNDLDLYKTAASVLLGKNPNEILASLDKNVENPDYKATKLPTPANIPSDLLLRRPDIKAAESAIKASAFRLGSARAAYFPSITLTGSLGYASNDLSNLISSSASTYGVGGWLLTPIFDFGRIDAEVEGAKVGQKIALEEYSNTVREATKEAADALNSYASNKKRLESLKRRYEVVSKNVEITEERFNVGVGSYLDLLDAKRQKFSVALLEENRRFETLKSSVNVIVALGGGFKADTKNP